MLRRTLPVLSLLALTVCVLPAQAETTDARSLALGGSSTASFGHAFSPLWNPAGLAAVGNSSWMLPSPQVSLGSPVSASSALGLASATSDTSQLFTRIGSILQGVDLKAGAGVEAGLTMPVFGYSGRPIPAHVGSGQLALGFNLWASGRGGLTFQGSSGWSGLLPNLGSLTSGFASATNLSTEVSSLSSSASTLEGTDVSAMNSAISTLKAGVSNIQKAIAPLGELGATLGLFGSSAQNLRAQAVADAHLTTAISAAAELFSNDTISVAAGINGKLFITPFSMSVPNPLNAGSTMKVPPAGYVLTVDSDKLSSFGTVGQALTDINKLTTQLSSDLEKAESAIKAVDSNPGDVAALANAASAGASLVSNLASAGTTISNLSSLQNSIESDLKNLKVKFTEYSDVSPVGFGVDLGVAARIRDDIQVGVVLQNPVVIWPAKEKTTTFSPSSLSNLTGLQAGTTTETQGNFTLSEPVGVRAGVAYAPKVLQGATVMADVEQVFNGRPTAVHVGGEKWFGPVAVRLGGQLGGTGNMVTAGLGVDAGPFNLDVGYGANALNPMDAKAAQGALSMSLNF